MTRWVDLIVIVLIALGALAVSAVAALYFIGPTRIAGGEAREYFLTFNAPPGTMTTEANAVCKGAAAISTVSACDFRPPPRPSDKPTGRLGVASSEK